MKIERHTERWIMLDKAMEEDFMKRAGHMTLELRISGFNQKMVRDR